MCGTRTSTGHRWPNARRRGEALTGIVPLFARRRRPSGGSLGLARAYFPLIGGGLLIPVVGALLAYLDWEKLRRDGVIRPFLWAWAFLSRELYVVGRSVVVREVAPTRGLAPIWAVIGVTTLSIALAGFKASALVASIVSQGQDL